MIQFRLSTLFVGVTVAALMFALSSVVLRKFAIIQLTAKGATAVFAADGRSVVSIDFRDRHAGDSFGYTVAASKVTDDDLSWCRHLRDVRILDLTGTQVSNVTLQRLKELEDLESLILDNTSVTTSSLKHITQLKGLKHLSLRDLTRSPLLQIRLPNAFGQQVPKVSGAELLQLSSLRNLQKLDLRGLQLDPNDVKRLQEALPKCRILIQIEPNVGRVRQDEPFGVGTSLINDIPLSHRSNESGLVDE